MSDVTPQSPEDQAKAQQQLQQLQVQTALEEVSTHVNLISQRAANLAVENAMLKLQVQQLQKLVESTKAAAAADAPKGK